MSCYVCWALVGERLTVRVIAYAADDWLLNNCAVRSRVCWKFRTFVQLKFLDCGTFVTAEDLTAQFTLDCGVCCVLKVEAQFVYSFYAVNIT